MTFSSEPVRKIEIRPRALTSFTDVSNYTLKDSTLDLTGGSKVSGGVFLFDKTIINVLPNLDSMDEIKITLGDGTPDTLVFTGVLRDGGDDDQESLIKYQVKSFAILASDRQATEVYRSDAGTGEPVAVFKDLVDKYLPELHYDDDSIPANTTFEDFVNYRLQNEVIKDSFDFIADYLKRTWYVDENKKIYLVTLAFEDTGYVLETNNSDTTKNNIIDDLTIATDLKRWANYVSVDGQVFEIGATERFTGDGVTSKFILSTKPKEVKVTVDGGDPSTGAIPDSDFSSTADYLVNRDEPSIEFTAGNIPEEDAEIDVELIFHSKIHDEYPDTGSISKYGRKDKKIVDDNIDTLQKAKDIALNALTLYSVPLKIYSGKTFWDENVRPLRKVTLKDSSRSLSILVNVLETNIVFGTNSFDIEFKLNDFDFTSVDLYSDLVNRVKRLEFNSRYSGDQIAKYLFFGTDFAISLNNLHISSEGICNAFTLDNVQSELDNSAIYLDGCNGTPGLLNEGVVRVVNDDNIFIEDFFSLFYKNSGMGSFGGPDWNITDKKLYMTAQTSKAQRYNTVQDFKIFHNTGYTIEAITPQSTETKWGNDLILYSYRIDGGDWTEPVSNGTRVVIGSGTEIEGRVIFIGNGANDTYIDQYKQLVEVSA